MVGLQEVRSFWLRVAVQGSGLCGGYEGGAQFLDVLMEIAHSRRGGLLFVRPGP